MITSNETQIQMFADLSTSSAIRVTVNNLVITDRKITVVKTELNRKIIVLELVGLWLRLESN